MGDKEHGAKISVISIIYKVEEFLPKAIESIMAQTYEDLEIILVVGKGKDDTRDEEICREYEKRDSRIKVVVTPAKGTGDARNVGLDAATGDYIGFVDGDDWVEPDMFEKLYRNLIENDALISICGKYSEYEDRSEPDARQPLQILDPVGAFEIILRQTGFFFHCWDKLFVASVFEGLRFPTDRYLEDRYVIDKALFRAGRIVYDNLPLYHYRVRGDSLSRVKDMAEYNTDADTEFCAFATDKGAKLKPLADSFLLYDHLTCVQNYLLYFKGQESDTERMRSRFASHMEYVRNARVSGNPEIGRSLKIKRLLALYAPGLLAFITRRHVAKLADERRFQ